MTQNQEGNQEHFRTVFMWELEGSWDRSEGVSGPAQWPGSGGGRQRGGRERVKSWLPWLMPQSSCSPCYNNTGSTKTGSTKLQPKSSDALTQKIPSPPQAAQGTANTHLHAHTYTYLRLLREQQTKAVNTAADGWADNSQSLSPTCSVAQWLLTALCSSLPWPCLLHSTNTCCLMLQLTQLQHLLSNSKLFLLLAVQNFSPFLAFSPQF